MILERPAAAWRGRGKNARWAAAVMRIEWQAVFWIGTFCVLALLLWLTSAILLPFIAAVALGYVLDPVVNRLERAGFDRLGATLLIILCLVLGLVLLGILIVPVLWRQLGSFVNALPGLTVTLYGLVSAAAERLEEAYGGALGGLLGQPGKGTGDLPGPMSDLVSEFTQWAASFSTSLLTRGVALLDLISLLVVTPVVTFYMLIDWHKLTAAIDRLIPPRHRETVRGLAKEIDAALAGFLRGQSLVCLFLAIWYGIGLTLVGLNYGLLIGIGGGILSFVPYVGSLAALFAAASVAIVQGWPHWTLLVSSLAVLLSGQFLEGNILSPKLVGESVGLHPVWLIFALLAFGTLFGFTGLIVAVPVSAALGVLLRFAIRRYRQSELYLDFEEGGHCAEARPVVSHERAEESPNVRG